MSLSLFLPSAEPSSLLSSMRPLLPGVRIVMPGEVIASEEGFLRGHGTALHKGNIVATVAGVVEQVNKLYVVRPLKSRYVGSVGDVVVGRVRHVHAKKWMLDIQGTQDAMLLLAAVHLPGSQRRRTEADQLQMRQVFAEGDVVVAEVQSVHADGMVALQTRSAKYGKLRHGLLVQVAPSLVKRSQAHMVHWGDLQVSMVLGMNGHVWVQELSKHAEDPDDVKDKEKDGEHEEQEEVTQVDVRERVCRVANAVRALHRLWLPISTDSIRATYEASVGISVRAMLAPEMMARITQRDGVQPMDTDLHG